MLILDDALSELDKNRRERLLQKVNNLQTIITCTDFFEYDSIKGNVRRFEIEDGKIKNIE